MPAAKCELTILGFLAFTIWLFNRGGVFDFLSESFSVPSAEHTGEAEHHRRLTDVHCGESSASSGGCDDLRWVPTSGDGMVHIIEDVHMSL